jgi:ATP-dependent helicase/nuclease subunit B
MSSIQKFPQITLADFFNQLPIGINSSVVVTPNRRLAMVLRREFNSYQVTQGRAAWSTPDILPIAAFIERLYEEILYSEQAAELPILLSTTQEQALWEDVISSSDLTPILFSVPEAAKLAREAWQIIHEWRLTSKLNNFPLNDDCKVFRDWSKSYKGLTRRENQIDKAHIYDLIIELWKHTRIKKPDRLICHGFDNFSPQQRAFLSNLSEDGCEVMTTKPQSKLRLRIGNVQQVSCADNRDEIYRAAVWARARIEGDNTVRIGVVVQEFSKYRSEIIRTFSSVMEPDVQQGLPGSTYRIYPFNVSLGMALASYPLVSTAFLVLGLAGKDIAFESVSSILRSPFLAGGKIEMTNRALFDEQLRKRVEPRITLEDLFVLIERKQSSTNYPILMQQISSLVEFRKQNLFGMQAPSVLARAISGVLQIFDFPGERALDSSEYQTLNKWNEIVAEFAALDRVIPRIGYIEGIQRLHRMAAETIFQPETPDVPIQILGVFEAAGMEFDHLWVMGLSDTEWPLRPRTNSFLPIELQRSAKLPRGSASESLELSRRFTSEWSHSSDEVIFSYPGHGGERDDCTLTPSPLIVDFPEGELTLPTYKSHRDLIYQARQIEYGEDNKAPELDQAAIESRVSGGTSVIKDHAACSFRAFALHRLGARGLKSPHTGLDTMERGTLVHAVLAQVWGQLKTKSVLDAISDDDLKVILSNSAKEAIACIQAERSTKLSKRFTKIEHQRLVRLTFEWLHEEKKRSDFRVIAIEDKRSIDLGGLSLTTRLDRVDRLNDERLIIIDYKTGNREPLVKAMCGERPDEPQLPLYLVASQPDATAVVFAHVKTGKMKFKALARDSDLLPSVKADPEWEQLVTSWRTDLTRIAESFSEGDAKVSPKKYPDTCRKCDLQSFCRIYERIEGAHVEPEEGA